MPLQTFEIELVERQTIAKQVMHFKFKKTDATSFDYQAGQFITLHLNLPNEEKELKRSYSVAVAPGDSEYIEFSASFVDNGRSSTLLFNMPLGDKLTCSGPYGRLTLLEQDPKRYVFVATGTGVTPYRAMLKELRQRIAKDHIRAHVLFGTRTPEDILFEQDFLDFAAHHSEFNYDVYLSRTTESLAQHQHSGYVQTAFETLHLDPTQDIIYLCGNPLMIDEAFAWLKDHGFDNKNVKREKYISK